MSKVLTSRVLPVATIIAVQAVSGFAQDAPDYSVESNWLCKAGRVDACAIDVNSTAIAPDGQSKVEGFTRTRSEKAIDCFYIYPTISLQNATLSNLVQEGSQLNMVRTQFARYASACRQFAPMYRQVTLKLMAEYAPKLREFNPNAILPTRSEYQTALGDVVAAWKYYLAHHNNGRGVILVGHSQGSFLLRDLIKSEIDGKDAQKLLVSAHLAGVLIDTPTSDSSKHEFKTLRACTDGAQTGCFISFSSFDKNAPPPAWNMAFGTTTTPGATNNCSNPADLSGDDGRLLPFIDASRTIEDSQKLIDWTKNPVETPLVALPDFYKAKCVTDGGSSYLAIEFVEPDENKDIRKRYIPGHVYSPILLSNWGNHGADIELTLGNLVKIASRQAAAWQNSKAAK